MRRFDLIDRMEMLAPRPEPPPAFGSGMLQRLTYGGLALIVLGGAWIRYNDRVAELAPALASPVAERIAQRSAEAGQPAALAELTMLAPAAEPAALAGMALPPAGRTALAADLRRDRVRLVQVLLFDAGAGIGTHAVSVSSGGYSRLVALTRVATVVTLPIDRVGTISFQSTGQSMGQPARTTSSDPVGIGMLTLSGPVRLPDIAAGQRLDVGVIAQ